MLNAYGPTECSDDVTHYFIKNRPPVSDATNMPIGFPISNHGAQRAPTAIWSTLPERQVRYSAAAPVCRGYLNNQQKTAEAFIPNPFQTRPVRRFTGPANPAFPARRQH